MTAEYDYGWRGGAVRFQPIQPVGGGGGGGGAHVSSNTEHTLIFIRSGGRGRHSVLKRPPPPPPPKCLHHNQIEYFVLHLHVILEIQIIDDGPSGSKLVDNSWRGFVTLGSKMMTFNTTLPK